MEYKHEPVMLKEVIEYLSPKAGGYFIDCTLGGGGYTMEIAKRAGEKGRVLAIDLDEMALENLEFRIKNLESKNNIVLVKDNFRNLAEIARNNFENKNIKFDGIVFDLGLSSAQLADRSRGFSFQFDSALNMAFGKHKFNAGLPVGRQVSEQIFTDTQIILNKWPQEKLEKILREYGEEKFARSIVKKIVKERKLRPITTTGELVEIIKIAVPAVYRRQKIHFATRTFQALRISTNRELENLEVVLPQAVELLKSGGKIAVISYHSLEDRIVKKFFKQESKECLCPPEFPICRCNHKAKFKILTKKAVLPSLEEINKNPRARSAKLRVAEKI